MHKAVKQISEAVASLPQTHTKPPRAFLVGGFVRDQLLGIESADVDVEVYGVDYATLKGALEQLFPGKVVEAGKSFGVFKIHEDNIEIDVALPRKESKIGTGHKAFEIQSDPDLEINEALRRRDFTINAVALDPLTNEVIDPFGGQPDLQNKTLRAVDSKTFIEDPLRVYRALQFVARFELQVQPGTFELMRQMVEFGELQSLSKERITEEWKKLLLAEKPGLGLELAKNLGLVEKYYPLFHILTTSPQDSEWHPEGSVWNHTVMAVECMAEYLRENEFNLNENDQLTAMLAALLHDTGKPSTVSFDSPHIHNRGHEEAGEKIAAEFFKNFSFSLETAKAAERLVGEHLKPRQLYDAFKKQEMDETQYQNAVRRLLKRLVPAKWQQLLLVHKADVHGRGPRVAYDEAFPESALMAKTIQENNLEDSIHQTLITGSDVLQLTEKLNVVLSPGPEFGKLIAEIEQKRDEGKIQTKGEALQELESLIKKPR